MYIIASNKLNGECIILQSILTTHRPCKIALRTLIVLQQAPLASVVVITCVTFGFQHLDTLTQIVSPKLTKRNCKLSQSNKATKRQINHPEL